MILQLTFKHKTLLAKNHIFYFEFATGEHFHHKIIFVIFNRTIFHGEFD